LTVTNVSEEPSDFILRVEERGNRFLRLYGLRSKKTLIFLFIVGRTSGFEAWFVQFAFYRRGFASILGKLHINSEKANFKVNQSTLSLLLAKSKFS
jgi:hypothetical protein